MKAGETHCNGRITWKVEHELPDNDCDDVLEIKMQGRLAWQPLSFRTTCYNRYVRWNSVARLEVLVH